MDRSRVGRGLAIMAIAALAVAVVSPAFSAAPLTKAKVKKIANKVVKAKALLKKDASQFEPSRTDEYFAFVITGDGEQVVASAGAVSVVARCDIEPSGTDDVAYLEARTTANGGALDDNNGPEYVPFGPGDSPAELFSTNADDDPEIEVTQSGSGVTIVAADGNVVAVNDYALGVNLANRPGTCFFSGFSATASV